METDSKKIVWLPQAKQSLALSCPVFELFYGGAVGGGKTDYLLADYLRGVEYGTGHRGIFLRRSYPELADTIRRSQEIYRPLGAGYAETKKVWTFPTGATLSFRHLESDQDVYIYQNDQFTWEGWDQLTNWPTDFAYIWMMSRLRSPEGYPCRVRSAGNPGGRGHIWVKQRFIDVCPPLEIYADPETGMKRVFIPAQLEDNRKLMENDPEYEKRLKLQNPTLYKAFRYGEWDIVAGQVFEEFRRDSHVVTPFPIPPSCYRFAAMDWGYQKPFSIGWWAMDHDGRMVRYREWYGCEPGKHNVGLKMDAAEVARKAWDLSVPEGCGDMVADPACWGKQGLEGQSIAETFQAAGWNMIRGVNDRKNGWNKMHEMMKCRGMDGQPMLIVFDSCSAFIRTVPALVADDRNPEDVDTSQEDHVGDETRYAVMSEFAQRTVRVNPVITARARSVKRDWDPTEY